MRNKVKFLTESGKKRMLSKYGIIYDKTTRNVLRVHNKNESWGHFLTKAVLYKLFRDKGYEVLMEAETVRGVIDVFVLDLELAIEVVSHSYPGTVTHKKEVYKRVRELVVVTVPEGDIRGFCRAIRTQVDIWL